MITQDEVQQICNDGKAIKDMLELAQQYGQVESFSQLKINAEGKRNYLISYLNKDNAVHASRALNGERFGVNVVLLAVAAPLGI